MKMKNKYTTALLAVLMPASLLISPAPAQAYTGPAPVQEKHPTPAQLLRSMDESNRETLSGIHLHPAKKGTFQLDFSQPLKENGLLKITNSTGKQIYQKPLNIAERKNAWRYNVGKLRPDIYLIEVLTSNTTYWTKFRVK
ncbi:hypothetical protein [Pontibacter chitinilyticus]|uniref:hypothetical protein n=1 Tax=Pontibacter chitinilyticus TaxID=2674989 RepID=UPI00321AA2BC